MHPELMMAENEYKHIFLNQKISSDNNNKGLIELVITARNLDSVCKFNLCDNLGSCRASIDLNGNHTKNETLINPHQAFDETRKLVRGQKLRYEWDYKNNFLKGFVDNNEVFSGNL